MLAQRNIFRWSAKVFENVAALQHDFPEPDIQSRETG
jgi:hypothetical protein